MSLRIPGPHAWWSSARPECRLRFADQGAAATISVENVTDAAARRDRVAAEVGPYGGGMSSFSAWAAAGSARRLGTLPCVSQYLVLGQYANAGEVMLNPHTITRKQLQIYGSPLSLFDKALAWLENPQSHQRFASEITDSIPSCPSQRGGGKRAASSWRQDRSRVVMVQDTARLSNPISLRHLPVELCPEPLQHENGLAATSLPRVFHRLAGLGKRISVSDLRGKPLVPMWVLQQHQRFVNVAWFKPPATVYLELFACDVWG